MPSESPLLWGFPGASRKAHVFRDATSLCHRWFFKAPADDPFVRRDKPGRDDCVACWRAAMKETEAGSDVNH
jgi:hypothetical protein